MPRLHLDFESRSAVDLKKTGVYPYAADASTDVWCAYYAVDEEEPQLWRPGFTYPTVIHRAVEEGWQIVAHNANFERVLWKRILTPRYSWPEPQLNQWRCTMVMAYAMALPGSLDNCAAALGLAHRKDKEGHALMLRMAKPRSPRKDENPDGLLWWDDEERRRRLYEYCRQDVIVEREIEKRLLPLRSDEQAAWFLDQEINDRGVGVDVELCHAAKKIVVAAKERLDAEMRALTEGEVIATTNVTQLGIWLSARHGIQTKSLDKEAIDELLVLPGLPDVVRRVLRIRREAAKGAVSKIDALLAGRDADGNARGLLQFHAASTGRWAGRRFQPQNIKRPQIENVEQAIRLVELGDIDAISTVYGEPLAVVGDCLRGMVRAPKGRIYYAADFANIEGRGLAWLAGETWKLDAFRAFDAGTGPDLYKLAYSKTFGVPVEHVTKPQRQVGKVEELALGYQGGVAAMRRMGLGDEFTDDKANEIKNVWREKHPEIVQLWERLNDAALMAVREPKRVTVNSKLTFKKNGSFLFLRLPSGRALCFPYPRIAKMVWVEHKKTKQRHTMEVSQVDRTKYEIGDNSAHDAVAYKGIDSQTRRWGDCYAYGGLWAENVTQAVARDVLRDAMFRTERAGYDTVLHVHDEIVAERLAGEGDLDEFMGLMATTPTWAQGFPIVVEGWKGERYRK